MLDIVQLSFPHRIIHRSTWSLYLEAVSSHALLVLSYEVGAFLLGVVGGGEQHALVALCLLLGAYATWLDLSGRQCKVCVWLQLAYLLRCVGVFQVGAHVGRGW